MDNCYYYNYKSTGKDQTQYDKGTATEVTEKELKSSALAKKLGSAFVYSKGNAPTLK